MRLAGKHSEQIEHAVDKAGGAIDKATKGKYSEKIEHGASKAKGAVDDFAHKPKPGEEGRPAATARRRGPDAPRSDQLQDATT